MSSTWTSLKVLPGASADPRLVARNPRSSAGRKRATRGRDFIESPRHDLLPLALANPDIKAIELNPAGFQYSFHPNWLQKPFDNPKVRQALFYAFNQEDFLRAVIGNPEYYKTCKSYFPCGAPL